MAALQLLLGVICMSALLGKSYANEELTLKKITLDPKINVCFTVDPTVAIDTTVFKLIIGVYSDPSPEHEHTMEDSQTYKPPNDGETEVCLDFKGDFTQSTGDDIFFILNGEIPDRKTKPLTGIETIKFVTEIPSSEISAQWIGTNAKKAHGSSLRIKEGTGAWKICGDGITTPATLTCKDLVAGPCYGVNIGIASTDTLSLCDKNDNNVQFIVKSMTPTTTTTAGPVAETISLHYGVTKATLATTFSGVAAPNEVLVYYETEEKKVKKVDICANVAECDLALYEPGDIALNIISITVEVDVATKSIESTFQDSNLELFKLDETVLESRWAYYNVKYAAERTKPSDLDTSFHIVDVDCTDNTGNCYAYFVNIKVKGDYAVTTKPGGAGHEEKLNTITSTTVNMNGVPSKSINNDFRVIHAENVATTVTANMIKLDVCFKYVTNIITNDTHYEFLAVNTKGKWKKQIHQEQKHSSEACFHELELPLADFSENSKFFVILRDLINGKPLASGEVTFNLPALRAIKPEVDNGSNGSTSTLAIVGAAIAGIACLMALVAAAVMFVMKIKRDNDGLQYPLHRTNIEQDSSYIHGLDNPIPTM